MRFVSPVFLVALLLAVCTVPPAAVAQTSSVLIPSNVSLAPQGNFSFSVTLSTPAAPLDGLTITLNSSNSSVASVWPATLFVPWGMTEMPRRLAIVTGFAAGTATITASAPGYATGTMQVQVSGGGGSGGGTTPPAVGTLSLSPANIVLAAAGTQSLNIQISPAAPAGGVAVSLLSSNYSVASVAAVVNIAAGASTGSAVVSAVGPGSATITAAASNYSSTAATVSVSGSGSSPAIAVPASLNLTPGDVRDYPIELPTAAPPGGVTVTALSSDTTKVTLSQSSVFIDAGATSAPRRMTTVTAAGAGAAAITVSAPGYAAATTQVQVAGGAPTPGAGTMSFSPATLSLAPNETKTLPLILSSPAGAGGVPVSLVSSNRSAADVPTAITIPAGTTTFNVPVAGIAAGTATISATASNYGSASASVAVAAPVAPTATIQVASALALTPGQSAAYPVTLPNAAGTGGASITLTSSDTSKATVYPSTLLIPAGSTSVRRDEPVVTALAAGSVTITASAPGFNSGVTQVQIGGSGGGGGGSSMSFSPSSLSLLTGATQNLTLNVTGSIPTTGLTVYLSSSNTSVATAPVSVNLPSWSSSIFVPVSAVGSGSATITATATGFGSATATITVAGNPQIILPSNTSLKVGETVNFPITLSVAAAADTLISVASGDLSKVTVSPASFTILKGMTSAPGVVTTVTGTGAGAATVTATAAGYTPASQPVTVTQSSSGSLTVGLSPSNLSISGYITQNLTLSLSGPAPAGGQLVNLNSNNTGVATVPATVTVPAGSSSVAVPVTALAAGSSVITASAAGIPNATATVTVTAPVTGTGTLTLPASWGVSPGQSNQLQASLSPAAPAGGATVTFTSSDPSRATVSPSSVTVPAGSSTATVQVNGVADGTATITASAPGYNAASTLVQVYTSTGSSIFIPGILAMSDVGLTITVQVSLGPQSPAGAAVTLVSSDPSVVSVPSTVVVPANSYYVNVPVTSRAEGSAIITATTANFGTAKLTVNVFSLAGVSVEWHGVCWHPMPFGGVTYKLHLADFLLKTPPGKQVMVHASLFFTSDCTGWFDNMNDFDTMYSAGHYILGFRHYPDVVPSSAMYWIGTGRPPDGRCPAGSICSGCMVYTNNTPDCSTMP